MGTLKMTCMIMTLTLSLGCSDKSIFKAADKHDVGDDAAVWMEKGRPAKAIEILRDALDDEPDDYRLRSLLSAAIAQLYGIDAIGLALKMAENQAKKASEEPADGASSNNAIVALFAVLPDATAANIAGLEEAITELTKIPDESRTKADYFKLSMLHTSLLGLRTKKFDKDGDGQVSPVEILSMSDDDAIGIISSLIAGQAAFSAGSSTGEGSAAAGAQIGAIQAEIDKQDGATSGERLKNYLNKDKAKT